MTGTTRRPNVQYTLLCTRNKRRIRVRYGDARISRPNAPNQGKIVCTRLCPVPKVFGKAFKSVKRRTLFSRSGKTVMAERLFEQLQKDGSVICESPKLRKHLYALLGRSKLRFNVEVTGYTSGTKRLCRWCRHKSLGWDLGRITKWIGAQRLIKDEIKTLCDGERFVFSNIEAAWTPRLTRRQRHEIIVNGWGESLDLKHTPFDNAVLHKTIVRITLQHKSGESQGLKHTPDDNAHLHNEHITLDQK